MDRSIEVMETTIPKGRTLRIEGGKGFEVSVLEGTLWLAQEHEDKTLGAGETCLLDRDGTTLAHAAKDVRLHIASPVWAGTPRITLGGGYREFGMSVVRSMFAEWRDDIRRRRAADERERAARRDSMRIALGMGDEPTPEEIQRVIQAGRRMRSEALHELLSRAGAWLGFAVQALRAPRTRAYWG